jgi:thiopeptide-type bacteriocin biosynthesis protein
MLEISLVLNFNTALLMQLLKPLSFNLNLDQEIICRTPAFTMEAIAAENFEELKSLIMESSPAFYKVIADLKKEDIFKCNEKIAFTLWKYHNRAKYRATPFGRFSGISVVPTQNISSTIILADNFQAHYFNDWKLAEPGSDAARALTSCKQLMTNSTLYKVGNEYRYLLFDQGRFEISVVDSFPELDYIIAICAKKKRKENIFNQLADEKQLKKSSITRLLTQLLSAQILITDLTPNITGTDFLQRPSIKEPLENHSPYIIAERKLINGSFNDKSVKGIPELITFLQAHLPYETNNDLQKFKYNFQKKFELRFIPLSVALDPEIGIGYASLANTGLMQDSEDLPHRFRNRKISPDHQVRYNPLLVFLLNKSMEGSEICLEEFNEKASASPPVLPNTFSVILSQWNDNNVIEHIGGCTANALIGRFTMANQAVEEMGKRLATIEQAANPEILFFDIAYQAERHIDNVNRRKILYEQELPILTWSCLDEPLKVDDILVGIKDSEIMLYSKKHHKRIIPRIPSAYNYHRSDLPLFRFLCDLQHQGIRTELTLNLKDLLPRLEHYSRVMYKDIILFPETWLMPQALVKKLTAQTEQSKLILYNWLREKGIIKPFKIGHADQTLVIIPDIDEDLTAFTIYCRQHADQPIYLSEAFVAANKSVTNESGNPLAAQVILNYYHQHNIYRGIKESQLGIKDSATQPMVPPGKDWLYFAIYCHPMRADELLTGKIAAFIKMNSKQISEWFFIRFGDDGSHLRLRLKLKPGTYQAYQLIENMQQILESTIETGQVSDIQIRSYFREIARYGKDLIDQVEDFFYQDSRYVTYLLKKDRGSKTLYLLAIPTLYRLIILSFTEFDQRVDFVNYMAKSYTKEFAMVSEDFKIINREIKTLNFDPSNLLNLPVAKGPLKDLESSFRKLMKLNSGDRYSLTADILHMHINRLFSADQRTHEAIIYQYLFQLLKRVDAQRLQEVNAVAL